MITIAREYLNEKGIAVVDVDVDLQTYFKLCRIWLSPPSVFLGIYIKETGQVF